MRVTDQITTYYRRRVAQLRNTLRWFRIVEVALALLGAALAAAGAVVAGSSFAPWIVVVTTITTAVAVHVAGARYEFQLIEFLHTADRLDQLKGRAASAGSVEEMDELASAAEAVIPIENKGWMAKLAEDPAQQQAAAE